MLLPTGMPILVASVMIQQLLIQVRQGWSDQEVIDAAFFDKRIKRALGLFCSPETTCDRTPLVKFRTRALEQDLDRTSLHDTLHQAAQKCTAADVQVVSEQHEPRVPNSRTAISVLGRRFRIQEDESAMQQLTAW